MNASTAARGRRQMSAIKGLDLRWRRHSMALAIGPLKVPTVHDLRALFAGLMENEPGSPLVCTIGGGGTRWMAVPPQKRAAHLERMVLAGDDLPYDDVAGYIERYRPPLDCDLPLTVVVGPESIVVYSPHVLGDGNTFSRMALMIANADAAGLAELRIRASFREALTVLTSESKAHWRDWARRVIDRRSRVATTSCDAKVLEPAASAVPVPSAANPRSAEAVLTNSQLSAIIKWRNQNCRGVNMTAVLASMIYRSLVEQGVPMDGTGLNTLVDMRRYLPADRQSIPGNLSQSVYLEADLSDPAQIAATLDAAIASARPVPGLVTGAVKARIRPPRRDEPAVDSPGPITMSLSSMPALPGLAGLPWVTETGRRYVGYAYPAGMRGISIYVVRLRDRMELTASFDGRAIEPAVVRSALENVGDASRLLAVAR
jgi:hypothetical protein